MSRDPDILRASQVQHAVQRVDDDGHLGRATPVLAVAERAANHPLELADVSLDQGAPVVSIGFVEEPRSAPGSLP